MDGGEAESMWLGEDGKLGISRFLNGLSDLHWACWGGAGDLDHSGFWAEADAVTGV